MDRDSLAEHLTEERTLERLDLVLATLVIVGIAVALRFLL